MTLFSGLTDQGAAPALVKTLAYAEARLKMIAENVANANTPGYRAKQLDSRAFQASLKEALDSRRSNPSRPFELRRSDEIGTDDRGRLVVTPTRKPVENALFHDGTNSSIERQMSDLAETGMVHDLAARLLLNRMDGLRKAIRGTV